MRITTANRASERAAGSYVLYWMIGARRTQYNPALERAVAACQRLGKPLLVLEPLRAGYRWASDRHHAFVLEGMRDNAAAFAQHGVTYLPYVEPEPGAGKGLLRELARRAALVITDEQPGFFLPHMVRAAGEQLDVRLEVIDGTGILPLRGIDKAYPSAALFRRYMQKTIGQHLLEFPEADPLVRLTDHGGRGGRGRAEPAGEVLRRWPMAKGLDDDKKRRALLAELPIDHDVAPIAASGGSAAAHQQLASFLEDRLELYAEARNQPEREAASGLSAYLHFGHLSAHQVVAAVLQRSNWDPSRILGAKVTGTREGWWQLPPESESFLDELITWRELGYGFCFHRQDYDRYESLPGWALKTLGDHASDPREPCYSLAQLEGAKTHDPLWNAAQRQLVREGRIHNYLRMLWGKKILQWTASPRHALAALIELNNKYAVDGRDPNSYSGIFWTLGRFDRPWPQERPVFGVVRYMSSENTARKVSVKGYLAEYGTKQLSLLR